jgi:hypothetical protein
MQKIMMASHEGSGGQDEYVQGWIHATEIFIRLSLIDKIKEMIL